VPEGSGLEVNLERAAIGGCYAPPAGISQIWRPA
jgi:hypothetical protein